MLRKLLFFLVTCIVSFTTTKSSYPITKPRFYPVTETVSFTAAIKVSYNSIVPPKAHDCGTDVLIIGSGIPAGLTATTHAPRAELREVKIESNNT